MRALCDALGITRSIVFGHSFGGYAAQAYATRHPDHPAKLILANTTAKVEFEAVFAAFERRGGVEAGQIARDYWTAADPERRAKFLAVCFPLYRFRPEINPSVNRSILESALTLHFNGPHNQQGRLDFRADLAKVRCPTLVIGGEHDPVMPIACADTIAAALPPHLVRFARFTDCGLLPWLDQQERAFAILREFILTG